MLQGGVFAMLSGEGPSRRLIAAHRTVRLLLGPKSIVESRILCPHCRSSTDIALVSASTNRCPQCLPPLMTPNRRLGSGMQAHEERSRRAITVAGERQPSADDRRGY